MYKAKAYSATSATSPFASTTIVRRDPTDASTCEIEILFCGICTRIFTRRATSGRM